MILRASSPAEAEFREAAAEVIRSNRRIRDNARRLTPFYHGDLKASEPAVEDRLSRHTDPKRNGAYKCIKRFGETLKKIMPGHVPEHVLFLLRTTTKSVVHESLESIHRSIWINQFDTLIDDIHDYLTTPQPELTPDEHGRNIDKFAKLWTQLCLKHSDELYNFASTIIEKRKQASKPPRKKTGKTTLGKGRQTRFMQNQRDTFARYLKAHPVGSVSIYTRARECWRLHKLEWGKTSLEGCGYSSATALAQAFSP